MGGSGPDQSKLTNVAPGLSVRLFALFSSVIEELGDTLLLCWFFGLLGLIFLFYWL